MMENKSPRRKQLGERSEWPEPAEIQVPFYSTNGSNMLKIINICCLALLLTGAHSNFAEAEPVCPPAAENPTPEKIQAAMSVARDRGFLWRISKDGRTSFLYGTIHVAKFDWMFPGPKVTQAIRTTDTLALELDALDPDIQARMAKGIAELQSTELPELMVKRLRDQAEAMCIPYDSIAKLTPEFQIITLSMMVGRWDGLNASFAVDAVLAGIGRGAKKNVVSLETPEFQLQLLTMETPKETISFVQDSLNELETGRALSQINRAAKSWESADYAEMSNFEDWCECLNTELDRRMMKRLNDDRNPNLAKSINALHESGKQVFAAVGSLHMFGPLGLPALMKKLGYQVEQVDLRLKGSQ